MQSKMTTMVLSVLLCLFLLSCTVKPQVSGSYHGISSSSGGEAEGRLIFSQPF